MVDALSGSGHDAKDAGNLVGAIGTLRIPLEYLAEMFTAGDTGPVRALGDARRLEESALPEGCSLEYEGGPAMGGDGPFGQDSGRRNLPLVSVENFHLLRRRQTSDDAKEA